MALFTMPRATQGMSKLAWNGLNEFGPQTNDAPSGETCSTLCLTTPLAAPGDEHYNNEQRAGPADGPDGQASPTSMGL